MSPQEVVDFVWKYETSDDTGNPEQEKDVVRALIDEALYRWRSRGMFADNIAVVIAFLSQEGTQALSPVTSSVSSRACQGAVAGPKSERRRVAGGSGCSEGFLPEGSVSLPHQECPKDVKKEPGRPAKRARRLADEETGSELAQHNGPPGKKSRQERDSGCESASGSLVTESGDSCVPAGSAAALADNTFLPATAIRPTSHSPCTS